MTRRWTQPTECGRPEWKATKRGQRCAAVCKDGRWRFLKKSACSGGAKAEDGSAESSSEVEEFSRPTGALAPLMVEPIQPMPLFPLVGSPEPEGRPKSRRRRRRG